MVVRIGTVKRERKNGSENDAGKGTNGTTQTIYLIITVVTPISAARPAPPRLDLAV